MTTPSIGAFTFLTMAPDLVEAEPQYIDQQSTGRNGTDSVLDAWRAAPQTVQCVQVYADYEAALLARESVRAVANSVQTVTDATGTAWAATRVRAVRPVAFAQADGTGLLVVDVVLLVQSVDTGAV